MNQLDILTAVKTKLADHYDYPTYLDEVKEGFQSPCFFLKAIRTTNRNNYSYQKNRVTIYITFFSEKGTLLAEELYTLQDTLFNSFTYGMYLLNNSRFIQTENLQAEIDGEDSDIVRLQFDVNYFDVYDIRSDTDYPKMNTIYTNERYQ